MVRQRCIQDQRVGSDRHRFTCGVVLAGCQVAPPHCTSAKVCPQESLARLPFQERLIQDVANAVLRTCF